MGIKPAPVSSIGQFGTQQLMELPYHLKTLPSDALDVIRYLGSLEDMRAYKDDICEAVGLSDRGFGKVIRRLVTKNYAVMDGGQIYRLTEPGREAAEELAAYDEANPNAAAAEMTEAERVTRRLVLAVPSRAVVGQPLTAYLGFYPLPDFDEISEIVARLSVIHGDPDTSQEAVFELGADAARRLFSVTPGPYQRMRLRVEVFQLGPNPDDITVSGGMYVDVDVTADAGNGGAPLVAYGADVFIERLD
jgi:hypothetical protein